MTTLMNQSQPPGGGGFKICDLGALVVAWPVAERRPASAARSRWSPGRVDSRLTLKFCQDFHIFHSC